MNELSLKTQMSIQKWLDIIHRCRESGLSNRQWCQENGIQLKLLLLAFQNPKAGN